MFKSEVRALVHNEIRRGNLIRQPCEDCDNPRTDAHHDDYDKPLKVRWLCRKHHRQIHPDKPAGYWTATQIEARE